MRSIRVFLFLLILLSLPGAAPAGRGSGDRIRIDGDLSEYRFNEWVLDEATSCPERPGDSRWGGDNDIKKIAVTWDDEYLYVAISCALSQTSLMLFLDTSCGGTTTLEAFPFFRRNISFGPLTPNLLLEAARTYLFPEAATIDCDSQLVFLGKERFLAASRQAVPGEGSLELAFPWALVGDFRKEGDLTYVPSEGQSIGLVAAVTGGDGTGAGDAAPDPSVALENDSTRLAVLDNYLVIPLDSDGDRVLDEAISPRTASTCAVIPKESTGKVLELRLLLERKVFSPDGGEVIRFRTLCESFPPSSSFTLSARVYSLSGKLVRVIYEEESRELSGGGSSAWDEWDGKDSSGRVVRGGVYILAVSGGGGWGTAVETAKEAIAVIR